MVPSTGDVGLLALKKGSRRSRRSSAKADAFEPVFHLYRVSQVSESTDLRTSYEQRP